MGEYDDFGVLLAVFVRQPVESDGPLPAGTFEETLDGVVPPQLVILLHAAISRFEVGVAALEANKNRVKLTETFP